MKNPYYPTALGLYFNYLVHGMGVILMSLNMASLETLWSPPFYHARDVLLYGLLFWHPAHQ